MLGKIPGIFFEEIYSLQTQSYVKLHYYLATKLAKTKQAFQIPFFQIRMTSYIVQIIAAK